MRLALYTFGQFIEPSEHPNNNVFHDVGDAVLKAIEQASGFVARSGYASDPGPESWGAEIYPRFFQDNGDGWSPATLSVWADLESPMAATYFGFHAKSLARGREWMQKPTWPPLVLWWLPDDTLPVWQEGASRLELLHDKGPTPDAFTFKSPFDSFGRIAQIDRTKLNRLKTTIES